jgi:hypothetical protein
MGVNIWNNISIFNVCFNDKSDLFSERKGERERERQWQSRNRGNNRR